MVGRMEETEQSVTVSTTVVYDSSDLSTETIIFDVRLFSITNSNSWPDCDRERDRRKKEHFGLSVSTVRRQKAMSSTHANYAC